MNKKTLLIIGGSIIGVIILLLLVLWLVTVFKGSYTTYEKLEEKMVEAAKSYYKTNPDKLPSENGKYTLSYNTLVESKKIKPLNEMLKDGDSCTAEIEVIKNDNNYDYLPKLKCGDKYSTKTLVDQILSNNDVVTQGSGLYHENDEYFFRGKITNNYILLGNNLSSDKKNDSGILWQIISIDKDNNVKIRSLEKSDKVSYDNRYNIDKDSDYGYNTFENSVFQDFLNKLEKEEVFVNNEIKTKFVKTKLCVGKRSLVDTDKTGKTECSLLSDTEYMFSTLLPYEYMRASIDNNCTNVGSKSCSNLNFIASAHTQNSYGYYYNPSWTLTPDADTSFKVYTYDNNGLALSYARNERSIYPVVILNPYVQFKSGDGTQNNPYIIK